MVDPEIGAIIGGCVAGSAALIAIVVIIVYLLCGKRRRKKEREQKKFRQLSPHTSPAHSQPSTLGHGPPVGDPRLPKVSSNGLWMGTPSIYAATPSPAYYYGRPGVPPKQHHLMQPAVIQRASSETRLPTNRGQVPTGPGGPAVYATNGSQQRIYHSQQLAGLTPVYEVMDPRNGSVYDVYQIGGGAGSKTKLLQESATNTNDRRKNHHQPNHNNVNHHHNNNNNNTNNRKGGKRLERSQSDLIAEPSRRPHRPKPSNRPSSGTNERAQVHEQRILRTPGGGGVERGSQKEGFENRAFTTGEKILTEEGKVQVAVVASATDSMKLLYKNKTDDQKTTVVTSSSSSSSSSGGSTPKGVVSAMVPERRTTTSTTTTKTTEESSSSTQSSSSPLHYTYQGDIYAVPNKDDAMRRSRQDNPILARMQDMISERADGGVPVIFTDPVTDIAETAEPLLITPREGDTSYGSRSTLTQNPIYQEVEEVRREIQQLPAALRTNSGSGSGSNREENNSRDVSSSSAAAEGEHSMSFTTAAAPAMALLSQAVSGGDTSVVGSEDVEVNDVAALSAARAVVEAGVAGEEEVDSHNHSQQHVKRTLEASLSTDTDGATDEQTRAGKHISVTAEAFDFLDSYLSDEDGGDIHSPPKSPVLSDRGMMY